MKICVDGDSCCKQWLMTLPNLDTEVPIEDTLSEHVHTLTTLAADPLTTSLSPTFQALVSDWNETNTERITIVIAVAQASANATRIDKKLNQIVDDVVDALKKITENDRTNPLWSVFFKGKDPSTFKRPTLGEQLEAMTLWPSALTSSPHKALQDIGAQLSALLPVGQAAETALAKAKQDFVEFKKIGRYSQHIAEQCRARGGIRQAARNAPYARGPKVTR